MVYGIRDQSPKFCLRSGSELEAYDRESQRWDWGSSIKFGIIYGIRDQSVPKKWAQGSK